MAGPFKMVDLKRSKESLNGKSTGKLTPSPYSYEHRISLDPDTLDKLGIDLGQAKVGDKYHVMGHGEVTDVASSDSTEGGKSGRISLQLKKMALRKKGGLNGGMKDALDNGISEAQSE